MQPEFCSKRLIPFLRHKKPIKNNTWSFSNCYFFHDKIFKSLQEASDFCENAFGKSEEYTGEVGFGHFPQNATSLKLFGKSQIWTYLKENSEFLHEIDDFICSCQSSNNNIFIQLKDSSVCSKAKGSQTSDSKICSAVVPPGHPDYSATLNINTVCTLVVKEEFDWKKIGPNHFKKQRSSSSLLLT